MRKTNEELAPMRTAATIVLGAFKCGLGISSTIWDTASYPVKPNEPDDQHIGFQ
jgi:hypothetical protein